MLRQPVLIFLYGHHYLGGGGWIPSSSDLDAFLDVLEGHNVRGTFFFDGISISEIMKQGTAALERINRQQHAIGYHGEEAHGPYPVLMDYLYEGVRKEDNLLYDLKWEDAVTATINRYSHEITYSPPPNGSGQIDLRSGGVTNPEKIGGIRLVQEAFSRPVDILTSHAIEAAPAGMAFAQMTSCRINQAAPPLVSHYLRIVGKQDLEDEVMKLCGADTGFFWYMNGLHMKEFKNDDLSSVVPYSLESLQTIFDNLSSDRPHLISMVMVMDQEKKLDHLENLIGLLSSEFCAKDPAVRFVTAADLPALFEPQNSRVLTPMVVREIAAYLLQNWDDRPPDWIHLPDADFSLANAFEVLAEALWFHHVNGNLPQSTVNSELLGPIGEIQTHWQKGARVISSRKLIEQLPFISQHIKESEYKQLPSEWAFAEVTLNAAELLYGMAFTFVNLSQMDGDRNIEIPNSKITPPYADILEKVFEPVCPNPLGYSKLQLWTVKPAKMVPLAI